MKNHMSTLRLFLFVACGWLLLSRQAASSGFTRALAKLHIRTPSVGKSSYEVRLLAPWPYSTRNYEGHSLKELLALAEARIVQIQEGGGAAQSQQLYDWCRDMVYFAWVLELEDNLAGRRSSSDNCRQVFKKLKKRAKSKDFKAKFGSLIASIGCDSHGTELPGDGLVQLSLQTILSEEEQNGLINFTANLLTDLVVGRHEPLEYRRLTNSDEVLRQVSEFLANSDPNAVLDICKWMLRAQRLVLGKDLLTTHLREFLLGLIVKMVQDQFEAESPEGERISQASLSQAGDRIQLQIVFNNHRDGPAYLAANFWNPESDRKMQLDEKLAKLAENLPKVLKLIKEKVIKELEFRRIVLSRMRGACIPSTISTDTLRSETLRQIGLYLRQTQWDCLDANSSEKFQSLNSSIQAYQCVRNEMVRVSEECAELREDQAREEPPEQWYVDFFSEP